MHLGRPLALVPSVAQACVTVAIALTAALVPVCSARTQTPQAIYPLNTDLLEATATYGPSRSPAIRLRRRLRPRACV